MIESSVNGLFATNTYIISNNCGEAIIVDPGMGIDRYVSEINSKYKVKAILITHGHIDHIAGIKYFKVPVYINRLEEKFLYDETLNLSKMLGPMMGGKCVYKKEDLDLVLLDDNEEFTLIGYKFKMLETPGHTSHSACFLYNGKLLSGDTLFKNSVGRSDFPTGNELALRKSVKKLLELPSDTKVYPGHEGMTTIREERKNNPYR